MSVLDLTLLLYTLNLLVGASVKWGGLRIGRGHHWLFAGVAASVLATMFLEFRPVLLVTCGALVALPFVSARHRLHPILAFIGFAGLLLARLTESSMPSSLLET